MRQLEARDPMAAEAPEGGYRAARFSSTVTICDGGVGQL
jgi:hypothetical protein